MKNTIRRMILGMQAKNMAGDYLAEIRIRQWSDSDEAKNLYLYAVSSPADSVSFYGLSEQEQWKALCTSREMGSSIQLAGCSESYADLAEATTSAYGSFYEKAERMLKDMKDVYEEEILSEDEESPDAEEAFDIPDNKEALYRLRLSLETDLRMDSIFHDSDSSAFAYEKRYVRALTAACESESSYHAWRKNYIESNFEETKNRNIVICVYIFNGYGHYEMILPQEELHPFQGWLQMSGAMDAGMRDATDEEIRTYIAMQAARKK